jgi:exodeoxyribonuclease VII large subunit
MDWFYRTEPQKDKGKTASLSVSEVTAIIKERLECDTLADIWVKGEVTKFKHHSRGHYYFTLSEGSGSNIAAVIDCAIWKSTTGRLSFQPADGKSVVVLGSVNVHPPHGKYTLIVREVLDAGVGEKYRLLEQWKKDLSVEGCFAAERKHPLPEFPDRVGIVTSETGAVIHDVITVIGRRYPVEIVISPTAVQGDEAHHEIAAAIGEEVDGGIEELDEAVEETAVVDKEAPPKPVE